MDIPATKRFIKQHIELFGKEIYSNGYEKQNNMPSDSNSTDKILLNYKLSIESCRECNLGNSRNNFVFGSGDSNADLLLVGEGPGENEDLQGEPFVGRAGKLLDKMLISIQLDRTKTYITNVVNYRPPENRRPTEIEIKRYLPYLKNHIEIINPKILVLLGSTALNTLIGNEIVISKARGKWIQKEIGKIKPWIIASFHPAFLMRQPEQKKLAWIDLKMIRDKSKILKI